MLPGISAMELKRLRMSVGYGTHKKGRWFSPIEVGLLLRKARNAGASLSDCATETHIDKTGVGRFLSILNLPQELQHLVDWGSPKYAIGFSVAVELVRLQNAEAQHLVNSILENGFNTKEIRQVGQLRIRSGRPIDECVKEVLGMRPRIEKRYVFIGAILDHNIKDLLNELTQTERDSILESGVDRLALQGASGRLGKQFFTLVGDEHFNTSMKNIGKDNIEARIRTHISETVENARSCC